MGQLNWGASLIQITCIPLRSERKNSEGGFLTDGCCLNLHVLCVCEDRLKRLAEGSNRRSIEREATRSQGFEEGGGPKSTSGFFFKGKGGEKSFILLKYKGKKNLDITQDCFFL